MQKLKVAIGVYGEVAFLEKFTVTDDAADGTDVLNDILDDCHTEFDRTEPAGLYLATFGWEQTESDWTGEYDSYLDIVHLEPLG
jgi:hypothetical protein